MCVGGALGGARKSYLSTLKPPEGQSVKKDISVDRMAQC